MSGPTAVVFDLGGVFTVDPFAALVDYASELGIPDQHLADAMRHGATFKAVERGEATVRDFLKEACIGVETRFGVRVDIRRLSAAMTAGQEMRPEMPGLARDLRAAGIRLGMLTNNAREGRSWWTSGVLPLELFEVVLDSSELGVRKPDRAAFEITLQRLALPGDQVVFVDDLQVNVEGARAAGLHAIRFVDPDQCRAALAALLPIAARSD